jgi:hypothetical protein
VLGLRVLAHYPGKEAMQGILAGLNDSKRRVRAVAVSSASQYLQFEEVIKRLQEIVLDEGEKPKISAAAMSCLTGQVGGVPVDDLPRAASKALEKFSQLKTHRMQVLFGLLRLDLNEQVEELLRDFVKTGSKEEAVWATRALCGFKVVNLGEFSKETTRNEVARSCERAAGKVFYWIHRDKLTKYQQQ